MRNLVHLSCFALLTTALPAQASDRLAELERRCAEQERQIQLLELENGRLKANQKATALRTAPSPLPKEESTPAPQSPAVSEPAIEQSPEESSTSPRFHVVRKGETLSGIAKAHGIKTKELAKLNKLQNAGMIRIGQKLELPSVAAVSPAKESTVVRGTHTVKPGETFYSIARKYGLGIDSLTQANPKVDPNKLRVGQELALIATRPEPEPAPETASPTDATETADSTGTQTIMNRRPTVRRVPITEQISLQQFADEYSMDVARLKRLNGLSDERYQPNTVLAEGSALFVSAQPLD